jgi:hypothetical protein
MSQDRTIVNSKMRIIWKKALLEYFMIIFRLFLRLKKTPRKPVTRAFLWLKNRTQMSRK